MSDAHGDYGPAASAPGSLTIAGIEHVRWRVVSITGYEAINELFRFEAVVTAPREDVAASANPLLLHHELPTQNVSFSLGDVPPEPGESHPSQRFAMIKAAHNEGVYRSGDGDELRLRLELVPRAWLLTQRRNSRIFQDRYVHEIVSAILCENGIRHAWQLDNDYPRRLYCTQYQETDYEFVTRLLAEEGIFFYFQHWGGGFDGGGPATVQHEQSDLERDFKTAMEVTKVIGQVGEGLSKMAEGLSDAAGSEEAVGGSRLVESAFGMVGDAAKALMGKDEAPVIPPGGGQAGPVGGGDVFFFLDRGGLYRESIDEEREPLRLSLDETTGMAAGHAYRLETLSRAHRSSPELVEVRDYDFRKPLLLLNKHAGERPDDEPAGDGQPPAGRPMEQYEHHGEYETPDITQETADILLEQHRRDVATYEGKGRTPLLRAGHSFELVDTEHHSSEQLVVVRIQHEFHSQAAFGATSSESERDLEAIVKACARAIHQAARTPELGEEQLRDSIRDVLSAPPAGGIVYQNFFTCVAREVPYRPPRPARVMRNVTESATVMGPVGQDIYTDRFGRVKVQFHWDRQGQFNENTSVWMRVLQPWAGAGYGFQFFPRVGMEVLVTFLGGDPDRPVVLGSLYNGTHPTPEPLPERATRSGIRTQSTPKGGGFNELSFDDAKGTERVYLHAERNFDAEVNHSHGMKVKHAHTLEVGARQHIGVEGEQLVAVGGTQSTTVGADQACCVAGSRRDRVVGNVIAGVEGNSVEAVRGVAVRTVGHHDLTLVSGHRDVSVFNDATMAVAGNAWAYVQEKAQINAKEVAIVASDKIVLRVGDSAIGILPDSILVESDLVILKGRDQAQLEGEKVILNTESGAMLRLRETAELRGSEINLTTPEASGGPLDPATHPPNVKLKFTHLTLEHGGDPIANTPFVVTTPTKGYWAPPLSGTTNANGELELHVPDEFTSVEVVLGVNETYEDIYGSRGRLRFVVRLVDSLGQADQPAGARMRLRNLGYEPGAELEEEEIDAATRQALRDFQFEAESPRSGELDDTTKRKLRELYGS